MKTGSSVDYASTVANRPELQEILRMSLPPMTEGSCPGAYLLMTALGPESGERIGHREKLATDFTNSFSLAAALLDKPLFVEFV